MKSMGVLQNSFFIFLLSSVATVNSQSPTVTDGVCRKQFGTYHGSSPSVRYEEGYYAWQVGGYTWQQCAKFCAERSTCETWNCGLIGGVCHLRDSGSGPLEQKYEDGVSGLQDSDCLTIDYSEEPSVAPSPAPTGSIYDIGPQSQFKWTTSSTDTPTFDWNITVTDFMSIDKATTEQGIYNLRSKYILDDRSFDVELFKVDCVNAPSGIDKFPLVFFDGTVVPDHTDPNVKEIDVELEWTYNQTKIESSDLWTANKTGGYSEFCIKVSNYLKENDHDFGREIHFLEVKYKIEVDSLTDFNETITVDRIDATDGGVEEINYEEEITVFQCTDDYTEITSPVPLTQGDFLQLCVTTKGESKFGVHSVKELDVSQQDNTPSLYPYVDGFVDSPLAESMCKAEVKNTSAAVCKTKMQLLSAYFDLTEPATDPAALFANGTVKLDYVGRRLSVDVPLNLRYGDSNGALKGAAVDVAAASRVLAEEDGGPSFGLEVGLSGGDGGQSDASTSALSMGGLFSAGMAFLAGAGML